MADCRFILGVNIAAGVAYLALVQEPGTPLLSEPTKMAPSDSYAGPTRLKEFRDRFMQEIRRLNVPRIRPEPLGPD